MVPSSASQELKDGTYHRLFNPHAQKNDARAQFPDMGYDKGYKVLIHQSTL